MIVSLLSEGTTFHSILQESLNTSKERLERMEIFIRGVTGALERASSEIMRECKSAYREFKSDSEEDESLVEVQSIMIDVLREFSSQVSTVKSRMEESVLIPFREFCEKQAKEAQLLLDNSEDLINKIGSNNSFLKELNKNIF